MNKERWLACDDPVALLAHLSRPRGDRKLRLYAVACCRERWHLLPEQASRDGVEWAERFADGEAVKDEEYERLDWATEGAFFKFDHQRPGRSMTVAERERLEELAEAAHLAHMSMLFDTCTHYHPDFREHRPVLSLAFVRDIFGNPFRPVTFDPAWRTSTVVALARGMYDARDFAPMSILADALQDAGCDHAGVLAHCRSDGPHVRGCWVVDLVLDKQ